VRKYNFHRMNTNILQTLVTAMQRRLAALPQRLRPFTTEFDELPKKLMLTGARGCGKSTFLLHHSQGRRLLYFSADNPKIIGEPLYDLVSSVFMLGYEGVIIDEIHYASNWSIHLKALYDDYPGKIIWISDSSSLVLRDGKADLSRRYVAIQMPLMSFREFLYLETGQIYPKYKLGDTILPTQPDAELLNHFLNYRSYGTRPFYQEKDFEARYMAIIDKILNNDIPFFLPSISENNLRVMRAIIGTLANSSIPRVQVTSLCSDWGIGAEKLYQLLFVMESVDLLKIVKYPNDTKARSTGAKMLFADPCAYKVLNADQGTEREAYTVHCFSRAGYEINAMKDEKKGDYVITKDHVSQTLEVGGKNKNPKEADYVLRDNTDYPVGNAIPFWLMGMMW
jgi:predicted AAA+ superfamily ATPase